MFDQLKRTEKFNYILDNVVDACMEYARSYESSRLLEQVPTKDHPELLKRFTHLKDDEFFEKRRETYKEIFKNVFTRNGKLISPEYSSKKKRLIISGTYFKGKWQLLDSLLNRDKSIPADLQTVFDKVNNNHTVVINLMDVMRSLDEFNKALEEKYPYPESIVGGEVAAICQALLNTAKLLGYNIIDMGGSHTREKSDRELNIMKGVQRPGSNEKSPYSLLTIAVTGSPQTIASQKEEFKKFADPNITEMKMLNALKDMAHDESYQKLMRHSDTAFLIYDNGQEQLNDRFTTVLKASHGKQEIKNHVRFKEFKDLKHLEIADQKVTNAHYDLDGLWSKKELDKRKRGDNEAINHPR